MRQVEPDTANTRAAFAGTTPSDGLEHLDCDRGKSATSFIEVDDGMLRGKHCEKSRFVPNLLTRYREATTSVALVRWAIATAAKAITTTPAPVAAAIAAVRDDVGEEVARDTDARARAAEGGRLGAAGRPGSAAAGGGCGRPSGTDVAGLKRVQAVQSVDRMIGSLRATLTKAGVAERTVVVFSSDNGYHMGEYRLNPGKQTAFDTDIHVPLIAAGPGLTAGKTVAGPAQNIDLRPTFDNLAGVTPAVDIDGHTLASLMAGTVPDSWRIASLIEHHGRTPIRPTRTSPRLTAAIRPRTRPCGRRRARTSSTGTARSSSTTAEATPTSCTTRRRRCLPATRRRGTGRSPGWSDVTAARPAG